jgi:hypothetical protein
MPCFVAPIAACCLVRIVRRADVQTDNISVTMRPPCQHAVARTSSTSSTPAATRVIPAIHHEHEKDQEDPSDDNAEDGVLSSG